MRTPSLPNPPLVVLPLLLLLGTGCGRKGDPIPRPRAEARPCVAGWAAHRVLEVTLPTTDAQGDRLVGLEAVRVLHVPVGVARPTPAEIQVRGEVILEQRRPDLPSPGKTLRLDLSKVGRPAGWIVVVAVRVGNVVGQPSESLPWLDPAI